MHTMFRQQFRELSDDEKLRIDEVKALALSLVQKFNVDEELKGKDRETSIAITKLEESIMWAVKSLTK